MNFMVYDLILLGIFVLAVSLFLFRRRKNLKREGLLFLYKTEQGIKLINQVGNKYKKTLEVLSYISITLGYALMAGILYMFGKIVWVYILNPGGVVQQIKVPPIMPLIPYIDKIAPNLNLPSFYFIYWIIIIAIVAITHEFSHGIFAAYSKVRIKKTGFGFFPFFLPVFLAAFVELDEKQMAKKKIKNQLAILSAGTFANVLTSILFFFVLWGFFSASFIPAGVAFDTYSYSIVNSSGIISVNGIQINNPSYENVLNSLNESGFTKVVTMQGNYFATKDFLNKQKNANGYMILYDDSPALESNLMGAITSINDMKTDSKEKLARALYSYSPGDKIKITTKTNEGKATDYEVVLSENPGNKNLPYLGIAFSVQQNTGITRILYNFMHLIKKPNVYYEPLFSAAPYIYDLFWWLVFISISVALMNMLPVGLFDGGRFFFLTILGITKSKKKAEIIFKVMTYLFLFLVLLMMVFWAIGMFGK